MAEQLSPTPHFVIVAGHPTDLEVAAITAALERHRARSASPRGHDPAGAATASRWTRAARLEGRGSAPIDDPAGFNR